MTSITNREKKKKKISNPICCGINVKVRIIILLTAALDKISGKADVGPHFSLVGIPYLCELGAHAKF